MKILFAFAFGACLIGCRPHAPRANASRAADARTRTLAVVPVPEPAPSSTVHATADAAAQVAPGVRLADVVHTINTLGPDSAVAKYFYEAPDGCGEAVTDSIAGGDSLWLVVADSLKGAVDACSGELLSQALALAMARAPGRVFRMFPDRPASDLCGMPFYEGTPESAIKAHYDSALSAVAAIEDSTLSGKRSSCLDALKRSFARVFAPTG